VRRGFIAPTLCCWLLVRAPTHPHHRQRCQELWVALGHVGAWPRRRGRVPAHPGSGARQADRRGLCRARRHDSSSTAENPAAAAAGKGCGRSSGTSSRCQGGHQQRWRQHDGCAAVGAAPAGHMGARLHLLFHLRRAPGEVLAWACWFEGAAVASPLLSSHVGLLTGSTRDTHTPPHPKQTGRHKLAGLLLDG
jgi:hypothetical protein